VDVSEHAATLTIHRTDAGDVGTRQVILYLDGETIGQLLFGQSLTRSIPPGRHRLRAYNTLVWQTVTFDVAGGEHARFLVINRPGRWTYPMVALFGAGPIYVTIRDERTTPT
jgi:hypothetical protein